MKGLYWAMALVLAGGAAQGNILHVDFGSGEPNANEGLYMDSTTNPFLIPVGLTITAQSGLAPGADPLFSSGTDGTLYWGNLGSIGGPCASASGSAASSEIACIGLGVQTTAVNSSGMPIGSLGISGDGTDANEAINFTWTNVTAPLATTVKIGILGYDNPGDDIYVYLEFAPSNGSPSDVVKTTVVPVMGYIDLSNSGVFPEAAGLNLTSVSILSNAGHFGVSDIYFEGTPEPSALVLTLTGLAAMGLWRRRSRAS